MAVFTDRRIVDQSNGQEAAAATAEASTGAVVAAKRRYHAAAIVFVGGGVWLGWLLYDGQVRELAPGVGVFAVLYVLAQAIERLLEPISPFLGSIMGGAKVETGVPAQGTSTETGVPAQDTSTARTNARRTVRKGASKKEKLIVERNAALADAKNNPNDLAAKQACVAAQDDLNQFRANASALAFGVAAFLAMLGAGYFGFLIFRLIGLTAPAVWIDLLVTGLAVGGGTKPLHDLIGNLKESKNNKKDPGELQA
jgi:hypothetical protein